MNIKQEAFYGMEKAARIHAQDRANRENIPMHVYRFDSVATSKGWDTIWYVRPATAERPIFAKFIASILPDSQ